MADVEYSYKHPTLFTITVQGRVLSSPNLSSSPQQDMSQWHLPAPDMRNEGKFMFKIHTVDLYFWTAEDAELFLDSLKRVLAPGQLRILDANTTHPEHRDNMSPVVQQLEKAAISPPQAQRSSSISTTHTTNSTAAGPGAATAHTPVSPPISPPAQDAQSAPSAPAVFVPMAYNPAAPAAPEPIAHREKTPPPPDAQSGTGLSAAATHDAGAMQMPPQQGAYMANPLQQHFSPQPISGMYVPGPPSMSPQGPGIQRANTLGQPSAVPSAVQAPSAPPQSPYTHSFAGPPSAPVADPNAQMYAQQGPSPQPGIVRQNTLPVGGYAAAGGYVHPSQAQYAQYAAAPPGYSPAPTGTPGSLPPQSPGLYQQQQPQQAQYMQAHGYQPQGPVYSSGIQHGVHQQLYIPEGASVPAKAGPGQEGATGAFEVRMKTAEKGVSSGFNKLLKRLDKKI
jgi:hypothetical protein